MREFQQYLRYSTNVETLYVEDSQFQGIILTNKQDETKLTKRLLAALTVPINPGTIIKWDEERWIIYQKERRALQPYNIFYIVRCNYYLSWINKEGHVQNSWAYVVSSKDSKIKENFRTWNSLITPQPNKFAEILIPDTNIDKYTKFIINDEGWYIVERDSLSVPGISYLSLSEDKVNKITDSLSESLANTDKLAIYKIVVPLNAAKYRIGDLIVPQFTLTKNGKPVSDLSSFTIEMTSSDEEVIEVVDNSFYGAAAGNGYITISIGLEDVFELSENFLIEIGEQAVVSGYIRGNDIIKLDRSNSYELITNEEIEIDEILWSISDENLVSIISLNGNICTIKANDNNKLGTVSLTATYNTLVVSKDIVIKPLW